MSSKSIRRTERVKMVRAMEYIARQVNDDEVFDLWVSLGIAEGILFDDSDAWLDEYITDERLSDLMRVFLRVMTTASLKGGLWCDGVSSRKKVTTAIKPSN